MKRAKRILTYKGNVLILDDSVYEPEHYSYFLEDHIILNDEETALDIVTGTGFHAIMMAERASKVVVVDINPASIRCATINMLINELENRVEVRHGDLFNAIKADEAFDLIVAWPPQFPTPPDKERSDWFGIASDAGRDGRRVIDRIIKDAGKFLKFNGRLQILQAWYTNIPKTIEMMESLGFEVEVTAEAFFPVGYLSFERASYLAAIGFPLIRQDDKLMQHHAVITGWWKPQSDT